MNFDDLEKAVALSMLRQNLIDAGLHPHHVDTIIRQTEKQLETTSLADLAQEAEELRQRMESAGIDMDESKAQMADALNTESPDKAHALAASLMHRLRGRAH